MHKMPRYFGIDMDGTLLNSDKKISKETIECLLAVKRAGIRIIIVSGRRFCEIEPYFAQLRMEEDDVVICCDGQYIMHGSGRMYWENDFLKIEDVRSIVDFLEIRTFSFFTSQIDYLFVKSKVKKFLLCLRDKIKKQKRRTIISDLFREDLEQLKIEKIVFNCDGKKRRLEQMDGRYTIHTYLDDCCEVLHNKVNKYTAIKQLCEDNLLELDSIVYFGDSFNDLECFCNLKYCIAMENAPKEIKERATFVTKTNDEDGVAVAVKKIICGPFATAGDS